MYWYLIWDVWLWSCSCLDTDLLLEVWVIPVLKWDLMLVFAKLDLLTPTLILYCDTENIQ